MSHPTLRISTPAAPKAHLPAPASCERWSTAALLCVVFLQLAACGGSSNKASHYERATSKQESCCQGLQDDRKRSECIGSIIRIDDASAEDSEVNEATFRCIEKNFVCDSASGHASQEASQAALDCITDLGQ